MFERKTFFDLSSNAGASFINDSQRSNGEHTAEIPDSATYQHIRRYGEMFNHNA